MIRDELGRALEILGDRLPGGRILVLARRAFGDRGIHFLRGDVEAVTGYPQDVFQGPAAEWAEIVHPADRDSVLERLGQITDAERTRLEYRVRRSDGGVRWLREDLRTIRKGPGAPPEVVGVMTDVTAERALRGRLSSLEAELWRARKMESVGKVAAEVAHDFNQLLTVILASCDLLRHEPDLPADAREEARMIRESAVRGRELVRRILSFAARLPSSAEELDLAESLSELEEILTRIVGERVRLEVEVEDEELWPVVADRAHVEQVLLNLVDNARDAMQEGGTLTVRLRNRELDEGVTVEGGELGPGRWVVLSVGDTGSGVGEHALDRIFEPFFSTKTERKGAGGLGLSTVLRIVRGYGGGIRVETEADRGTTFHLFFPVREEGGAAPEPLEPPERDLRAAPGDAPGLRILVLDDDEAVLSVIERVLTRRGHRVAGVSTPRDALRVFDRVRPPFDLLVADVMLPNRSGPEVHQALSRRARGLPAIFMSGYGREQAMLEGMVEQDALFLEKPFTPGELVALVERARERVRDRRSGDAGGLADAGEAGG